MPDHGWDFVVLVLAYLVGAVPFSNFLAHRYAGLDLRDAGTGTTTPANLHRTAGLRPALLAGALEVAKGMVGPVLIGPDRPVLAAVAGGLAVAGHNWSPLLGGRGGRGISTATGALLVVAWPGAVFMSGCLLLACWHAGSSCSCAWRRSRCYRCWPWSKEDEGYFSAPFWSRRSVSRPHTRSFGVDSLILSRIG